MAAALNSRASLAVALGLIAVSAFAAYASYFSGNSKLAIVDKLSYLEVATLVDDPTMLFTLWGICQVAPDGYIVCASPTFKEMFTFPFVIKPPAPPTVATTANIDLVALLGLLPQVVNPLAFLLVFLSLPLLAIALILAVIGVIPQSSRPSSIIPYAVTAVTGLATAALILAEIFILLFGLELRNQINNTYNANGVAAVFRPWLVIAVGVAAGLGAIAFIFALRAAKIWPKGDRYSSDYDNAQYGYGGNGNSAASTAAVSGPFAVTGTGVYLGGVYNSSTAGAAAPKDDIDLTAYPQPGSAPQSAYPTGTTSKLYDPSPAGGHSSPTLSTAAAGRRPTTETTSAAAAQSNGYYYPEDPAQQQQQQQQQYAFQYSGGTPAAAAAPTSSAAAVSGSSYDATGQFVSPAMASYAQHYAAGQCYDPNAYAQQPQQQQQQGYGGYYPPAQQQQQYQGYGGYRQ